MSKFVKGQSSKKGQLWLQRLVKFWLASGMIAMPWMAYADNVTVTNITRTDNGVTVVNGNVHNVYAGKDMGNGVGASTFSRFDIKQNDIANMHFRTSATSTNHLNTLLNFVDSKININGTVNAIRNSRIGGHLCFLSPNGMAVGTSGAINAGALTVITPTSDWWKEKFDGSGNLKSDYFTAIQDNTVPINASGTITVLGQINTTDNICMRAGTINIGKDGSTYGAAKLTSGIADFSSVVNISNMLQGSGIMDLQVTRAANGGDIILAAEVSYNANADIDADKVNAELNVAGGSQIKAYRNANLTATALNSSNYLMYQEGSGSGASIKYVVNGKTLTEEQFKTKYGDAGTNGTFKTEVKTSAVINIADSNTKIEGRNISIVAESQNVLDNSMTNSIGENTFSVGMSVLFNGFDVCLGDLTTKAEVNIAKDVVLKATGLDGTSGGNTGNALNVQALATTQISIGTWAGSINLASVIPNPIKYIPSTGMVPSVMFNLAKGRNEANVNIYGMLKADAGKINVGAIAKNSITSGAASGLLGTGLAGNSNAVLTIGINGVEGYNKSNIIVGSMASIEATGDVELDSHAISSIVDSTSLTTTEKSTMAFGIGWLDYDNVSTLDLSGTVKSDAAITLDGMAKYEDNTFTVSVSAGQGFVANLIGDKFGLKNLQQSLLDGLSSKIGPAISQAITGEADNFAQDGVDGENIANKLADNLKLGISFGYMKEKNVAYVNIQPTATITSLNNGNVTVNAKVSLEDVYTDVVGASNNKEKYQDGSSSAKALVNGAVFLRDIVNEGNLTVDTRTDGKTAVIKGGKITLDVSATAPYSRVKYMVAQLTEYYNKVNDICDTWDNPTDEDLKILKKYHEAAMTKKSEIEADMYDAEGNLLSKYADEQTGSAELLKKMNEFQQTQEYKDYYKLLSEGTYTENGVEKTIGNSTQDSGMLQQIMGVKNLLTKGLIPMVNPQSYFSYSVAAEIGSRSSKEGGASKFGIGVAFGMDSFNNNARILLGKNTFLDAAKDAVINVKADYGDIICNGGWLYDSAGTTGANMDLITIQHLNNNSIVAVAEGVNISSKENISAKVENDINHIGVNKPILASEGGAVVIDVAYFTTESNTVLSIDDEVVLNAGKTISLTGENTTKGIVFTGAIAAGDTKTGAVSVAYSDIDRNNIVGIVDNDGAGSLSSTDIKEDDTDELRMQKLLAGKSGLTADKIVSFYSDSLKLTGNVGANALDFSVTTDGKLGDFIVDIAVSSHDESEKDDEPGMLSKAASWLGGKLKTFIGLKVDEANNDQGMTEMRNIGENGGEGNEMARQNQMNENGDEAQDAHAENNGATLSLAGAGSGGFVDLDAITASVVKGTEITLAGTNTAMKNNAKDDSLLVTVAGGVAVSKNAEVNGGDSSSYVLSGAVNINDVDSKLSATIADCKINGTDKIDNLAMREGALANAAAAVSYTSTGSNVENASGAFGAAVNLADYCTDATMLGNTVNSQGTVVTQIVNMATDKDIQITGGIEVDIVKGGKKATGVGGVVSWAYLNNKVNAVMENGDYKSLGAVTVEAITDLTQINAALGIGVSSSTGGSKAFQGALVYGKLVNDVKANIKSATIVGDTLQVAAYDTNDLTKENAYADALKQDYGFDVNGSTYISHAQEQTKEDNGQSKTTLQDKGNLIVSAAVEVAAATGAGSDVAAGASAVIGIVDNDFNSIVEGSTITLTGTVTLSDETYVYPAKVWAESSTLQVGVAAGGNGSESGFAGGGSAVVNLFENDVYAKVEGSIFNAAGLQVDAKNKQKLVNVAGQIDVGKNAIGLDMVYNYMLNNTGAYFTNSGIGKSITENNKTVYSECNLVLDADNDSDVYAIALGVSASANYDSTGSANGSIAVNRGQNNVEAVAENNSAGNRQLVGLKTFTVHSKDDSYLAAATGGLTLTIGKTAFGGSLTWNRLGSLIVSPTGAIGKDEDKKQVNKAIVSGYDIHMADNGVLIVKAEDKAKFNTVAIGLGIGTANTKFTLQGANANAYISKETTASVLGGSINQDDKNYDDALHFADVNVAADTDNEFNTVSVVVATSGKVALGAALGENTMKADTKANVAAGADKGSYLVKDMLVKSTSKMDLTNVVVGVAASGLVSVGGSVVDNIIENDTTAEVGNSKDGVTVVIAKGGVGVVSHSEEDFDNYSGQANITIGTVGGGIAVALNEIKGDTLAIAQNAKVTTMDITGKTIRLHDSISSTDVDYTGLVIGADALHDLYNAPFCAGLTVGFSGDPAKFLALGLDATVSTDNISGKTRALMKGVSYNETIDLVDDVGNNLTVLATDKLKSKAVVTNAVLTLAIGDMGIGASVGAGVNVEKNSRTVEATADGDVDGGNSETCNNIKRKVNANTITIKADSDARLEAVNTAVSVQVSQYAGVSVSTGVTYADLNVTTLAKMKGIESRNNGLNIIANHKDHVELTGTGVTLSVSPNPESGEASVGVHVDAQNNTSDTQAVLENSTIYHNNDNKAVDNIKATSDSYTHTQDANITATIAALGVSVGVLVADNDLTETVKATVSNTLIGDAGNRAKDINILSNNIVETKFNNQNVSVATIAGIGVGVGLNTVDTSVATDIMNSTLYAGNDINAKATEIITLNGNMVSATVGALSVGVSTLHNYVGTAVVAEDYAKWVEENKVPDENNAGSTKSLVSVEQMEKGEFSATKIDGLTIDAIAKGSETVDTVKKAGKTSSESKTGVTKKSARSVTLNNTGDQVNLANAKLHAGNNITAEAKEVVNSDTMIGGGSVGFLSVQVESNRQRITGKAGTTVTGGILNAGNDISVSSLMSGQLKNNTVQVGIGGVPICVTIGELTKKAGGTDVTLNGATMIAVEGSISLLSKDNMAMLNKGTTVAVGAITASAVDYTATDNASSTITLKYDPASKGNNLEAKNITITSLSVPNVVSDFDAVNVSLVTGAGVVVESRTNNKAILTLEGTNRLWADTLTLGSKVYADGDKYSAKTSVFSGVYSLVSVLVNKARTYSDVYATTTVGALTLKTETEKDESGTELTVGLCDVVINAEDATNIYNFIDGRSNGLVAATGTNYAQTDIKSNVSATVDAGSKGLYAKTLSVASAGKDVVNSKASGYGVSVLINISPVAAGVETKVTGNTKTVLKGLYNVKDTVSVGAVRQDELVYTADSQQIGGVVGAGGVKIDMEKSTENTLTELDDAVIKAGGMVNVLSNTKIAVNNIPKSDAGVLDKKDKNYVVNGVVGTAGSVGIGVSTAEFKNIWEVNNTVNIDGGKIISDKDISISAYTEATMNVFVKVGSASIIYDGAFSSTVNDLTVNDIITLTDGTEIRSEKEDTDVTIAASDNLVLDVRGSAENTASLSGTTKPKVENTVHRNNGIDISNGKVFSMRDVNLFAGKKSSSSESVMDLILTSISFNRGLIPAGYRPTLTNTIEQKNSIDVGSGSDVQGVRHVTLYADNGRESINKTVKNYGTGTDGDYGSAYISTSKGNLEDAGIQRKNYVQVDGTVTAGIANNLAVTIGKAGDLVFLNDTDRAAILAGNNPGKTIYSGDQKESFISFGDSGSDTKTAAEIVGLTVDKFLLSSEAYRQTITKRLGEINQLLGEYSADTNQTVYNGLKAEAARLEQLLTDLKVDTTWDKVEYISVPDLVASGGNVIVNTRNFSGEGTVTAKGNPSIAITNYTNLTVKVNNVTVDDPGGVIYYKGQVLDPNKQQGGSSVSLQTQVQELNADHSKTVSSMNAAKGTSATITVKGMYGGSDINYSHVDTDNSANSFSGSFTPRADVLVNGNINSLNGAVTIYSENNNVTIEGKTVNDAVSVNGKVVNISAPKGNITQGFTNGIVNIGGDVKSLYSKIYETFIQNHYKKYSSAYSADVLNGDIITTTLLDGEKAPEVSKDEEGNTTGNWIAGGQVFINAADININGIIQSGYDYYYVNTEKSGTSAIENRISLIDSKWIANGQIQLQDDIIKGSGSEYKVIEGGAYWNASKGCYEYRMDLFYNPSTKQLLTSDVDINGGRIYLTGRISSTGNGKIICLDGAYNIDVKNTLNYDLRVGKLAVNDTQGKITFTDSLSTIKNSDGTYSAIVTEITTSGVVSKNSKTGEIVTDSHIAGSGRNYTYTPTSGLRYNWVEGYKTTSYARYKKTDRSYWWGATKFYDQGTDILDKWSSDAEKLEEKEISNSPRKDGAYITVDNSITSGSHYRHSGSVTGTPKYVYEKEDTTQSGWWIFKSPHIYHYTWFKKEQGQNFYDYASIKADNPISITFIGTSAENASVNIDTTSNLYINGKIGNTRLYEVETDNVVTGHVEKGMVNLTSGNASIIRESGSIYGAKVNLTAAKDMRYINITAGDTVALTGLVTGVGSADITVDTAYGGAKGKVLLGNLGGSQAETVSLTADGDISQISADNLVEAKRINLTTGTGGIGGEEGSYVMRVKAGQSKDADGTDSLKASINVSAAGNIALEQVSGDLRVGKINSENGDVLLMVSDGGIIDALPYTDSDKAGDEELLSQWRDMGVILNEDGSKSSGRIQNEEMQKDAKNEAENYKKSITNEYQQYLELQARKAEYEAYKATVIQEYAQLSGIKAKIEAGQTLTEAEQSIYNKYNGYESAEAYLKWTATADTFDSSDQTVLDSYAAKYSAFASADAYLAADSNYQTLVTNCAQISETYAGWDADQLLFAIQESVINQKTGVQTSDKDVNIYGNNIVLFVKNGVGLNSADEKIVNLATLGDRDSQGNLVHLDDLKTLATADASTVKWYKDANKAVITSRLAIGVQQKKNGGGTITVNRYDDSFSGQDNIYIESRNVTGKDTSVQNYNLQLNALYTNEGNVSVTAWGDILNSSTTGMPVIIGNDLVLQTGATAVVSAGNIGTADKPLTIDISGNLTALATGNVYVTQGNRDLYVASMAAGPETDNTASEYGNIYLVAGGNIYGYYDTDTEVEGYIRGGDNSIVSVVAKGNIGSFETENGIETKILRFLNCEGTGVIKLSALDEIVVEGVSSNVRNSGINTPGGILNVEVADSNTAQSIKLNSNGKLSLNTIEFTDTDSSLFLGAVNLTLNGNYSADVITLSGSLGIDQKSGSVKAREVTLISGELLNLTYGAMKVAEEKLEDAEIIQSNSSNANGTAKIIARTLNVRSYGRVSMDNEENQFTNVHLDAGKDVELGGSAYSGQMLLMSSNSAANVQVDISNSHANSKETFLDKEYADFTKGDVSIMLYKKATYDEADLTINDNVHATGDIILYNAAGKLSLPSGTTAGEKVNTIYAEGLLMPFAAGGIDLQKETASGEGTILVAEGDITASSQYTYTGGNLYLRSLSGNVSDIGMGSVGLVSGDLTLIADEGTVFNTRAYLTLGDITLRAQHNIGNTYLGTDGYGMHSLEGNITIYTMGSGTDEGILYNDQPMKADSGYIFLYANKNVYNNATIAATTNGAVGKDSVGTVTILSGGTVTNGDSTGIDYIYGENGVTIVAVTELQNKAALYASKGDIIVGGVDDYFGEGAGLVTGTGKVTNTGSIYTGEGNIQLTAGNSMDNSGDIYVAAAGNVTVRAETTLSNFDDIYTKNGIVTITAGSDITNTGSVYSESGDVAVNSSGGKVDNGGGSAGNIYALAGNVEITAATTLTSTGNIYSNTGDVTLDSEGDLDNTGSLYAAGTVALVSCNGNITNSNDFKGIDVFSTNITLSATNGSVTNSSALTALQNITILVKDSLSINANICSEAGDIYLCSSNGDITNASAITANDGNITVVGKNIVNLVNSEGIIAKQSQRENYYGQVTLVAMNDIINVNETVDDALIYGQNGVCMVAGGGLYNWAIIKTETGDVLLNSTDEDISVGSSGNTVRNYGSITVATKGDVSLKALEYTDTTGKATGGSVINSGTIETAGGYIYIYGGGAVTNSEVLLSSAAGDNGGDISIFSSVGAISSTGGSITAQAGDIVLFAPEGDINNTANITAKDTESIVILLSGGTLSNTGTVSAKNNVHLYGYSGVNNNSTAASITTENGDVAINHFTGTIHYYDKYSKYWEWIDPVGSVSNTGNVTVSTKGNIYIGTEHTNFGTGDVTNSGQLSTVEGNIIINSDGNLTNIGNIISGGSGTVIGGSIELVAKGNVKNSKSVIAYGGGTGESSVKLISKTGDIDCTDGIFGVNTTEDSSLPLIIDGDILFSAEEGSVINNKAILANGDVTICSKKSITNNLDLGNGIYAGIGICSMNGNISIYTLGDGDGEGNLVNNMGLTANDGYIYIYANQSVSNDDANSAINATVSSSVTVDSAENSNAGKVFIFSDGSLTNQKTINAVTGVYIEANGAITNGTTDNISTYINTTQGDIEIISTGDTVTNNSLLTTGEGNVMVEAKGNLTNKGSIVAIGHTYVGEISDGDFSADSGWVVLLSKTGNISNDDDFFAGGVTYADGSIWMEAKNGAITNTENLVAQNNIVLKSKTAVINEVQQFGLSSIGSGDIVISATDTSGAGVIYNNSEIATTNGNIQIQSSGNAKQTRKVYDENDKDVSVSILNGAKGNIKAVGGDVIITGEQAVVNEGDICLESSKASTADLTIISTSGDVLLYKVTDSGNVTEENTTGENIFQGDEDVCIAAPEGILYNEKNIKTNGDIYFIYGGYDPDSASGYIDNLVVSTEMTSTRGDIYMATTASGTVLEVTSNLQTYFGDVLLNSQGGINVMGNIDASYGDINIGAVGNIGVKGNLTGSLKNGLVALGTQKGETLDITGTVTGSKVVLYTESKDTVMSFNKITFGDELTLAGNHWRNDSGDSREGSRIYMSKVTSTNENLFNIRLYSAGGTNDGANYDLDFGDYSGHLNIPEAVMENLTIRTNGRVTINDLSVSDRADIYTMGTKTSIFGQPHDYDGDAVTIYYAKGNGAGASIWLHDMFFGGGFSTYQDIMEKYKADSTTNFVTPGNTQGSGVDGQGKGMYLDIISATEQCGDGMLLKTSYGTTVYRQRFTLEQMMQHLLDLRADNIYSQYFDKKITLSQKVDLVEIPDVVVNYDFGITDKDKVLEFDF